MELLLVIVELLVVEFELLWPQEVAQTQQTSCGLANWIPYPGPGGKREPYTRSLTSLAESCKAA